MGNISINTAAFAKELEPGIQLAAEKAMGEEMQKSAANLLFTDKDSDRIYEEALTTSGAGQYQEFDGQISFDEFKQMYDAKFYNTEYVTGFMIQRKFLQTNQYNSIWPREAAMLGFSAARSIENISMAVFRNADNTTSITLPDGKAIVATDHPSTYDGVADQSNKGTTALSIAALEAAQIVGKRIKTYRGDPMWVNYDTLLIPPELEFTAERIVNSMTGGVTLNSSNAVNTMYKKYKVIVSPFLSDANNFFLIDSGLMRMNLYRNWVVRNEIGSAEDFSSYAAKWRGYFFMGCMVMDWRWIYGGIVA
uniref:Putative capsid protein n=1 Tax=viral metagenome TaxID=1070528 RepID=A0A6H1ZX92_9ZZZZ